MATSHDTSYQTGIYVKQGGQELHLGNPVLGPDGTGAAIVVGPDSKAVNLDYSFAPAPGAATICNVTIRAKDGLGNNVSQPFNFDLWLSDAADGTGLTATVPSGGMSVTTGTQIVSYVTNKALRVQSDATGTVVIQITSAGKVAYVVACQNGLGVTRPAVALLTANYG